MRTLRLLSITGFALLVLGGSAHAEEDPISDTARELFQKGMKAYDQQKWDQCRAALLAAFAIKRHSQIAGNLAECELRLGAYRDAAEHAWFFAHTLRPDAPPERRAMAETALRQTQQKVGTVVITVDVDDADVLVDGKSAGKAPLVAPVFVEPGQHTVEALHVGDPGVRVTVDAGAGETREVLLTLRKKMAPPVPHPVADKRPLWPALAAGGVAVVAFAVGGGLTGAAGARRADAVTLRAKLGTTTGACASPPLAVADCQSLQNDLASHDALNKAALGSFVAGGALAVAAAGLGAWWATGTKDTASKKTGLRVAPAVGPGQAGVTILGTW